MTQAQLARRLLVAQQTVARWEAGAPPRPTYVPRILQELGLGPDREFLAGLAEVIPMRASAVADKPVPEVPAEYSGYSAAALRHAFIQGCTRQLLDGRPLPDELLVAIARELGLPFDQLASPQISTANSV